VLPANTLIADDRSDEKHPPVMLSHLRTYLLWDGRHRDRGKLALRWVRQRGVKRGRRREKSRGMGGLVLRRPSARRVCDAVYSH
jgi:hypothetical protein